MFIVDRHESALNLFLGGCMVGNKKKIYCDIVFDESVIMKTIS